MLHTLRYLIGDDAFFAAMRLAVYGRIDPKPGNFAPRFGSTAEFERFVRQVTGKDYGWFFDVYLRQAALPELIVTRTNDRLSLSWQAPGGGVFPMPVDVRRGDGTIVRLSMANGTGMVALKPGEHVVADPFSRILKRNPALEAARAWRASMRKAAP